MSFAGDVKTETLLHEFNKEQFIAYLLGHFVNDFSLEHKNKYLNLIITTNHTQLVRKIVPFFKDEYGCETHIIIRQNNIRKNKIYKIEIYNVKKFLEESEYFDFTVHRLILDKRKEYLENDGQLLRAYFCGLFNVSGSVNSPSTANYHLELIYNDNKIAIEDIELLKNFSFEFKTHIRTKNKTMIYIKKSMYISDFLKFIDAPNSVLQFEGERIKRDFKNSQNRILNIEASNGVKVIRTGKNQIKQISYLVENGHFEILSDNMKILCYERLEHESATYDELAEIMTSRGIKLSKPRIGGMFSELKKIYERIISKE